MEILHSAVEWRLRIWYHCENKNANDNGDDSDNNNSNKNDNDAPFEQLLNAIPVCTTPPSEYDYA